MTADDIEQYRWLEFVAAKLGTRKWTVGNKLTDGAKALGYVKAIPQKQLDKLRSEFDERNQ